MSALNDPAATPDSPVSRAIQEAVAARGGPIPFATFMELALYHPEGGYYRRDRERVGFGRSTDFFTATSTGGVFANLVIAACVKLLGPRPAGDFTFVEIGAEPGGGVLSPAPEHPFKASLQLRLGESFDSIPEQSVVFSNELFDAQPFHRLVFGNGAWREIGVDWKSGPVEAILPSLSPEVTAVAARLPADAPAGYRLDLPLAATVLLNRILDASPWRGLFVAFDYGKSWRELIEATPQGTARAYHRHQQSNDLLAQPGDQDLTCHVCWDWLEEPLRKRGFKPVAVESQEAFFVKHSTDAIRTIISDRPGTFDPRRQTLQQLLHPGNMGQKFQVLHAVAKIEFAPHPL